MATNSQQPHHYLEVSEYFPEILSNHSDNESLVDVLSRLTTLLKQCNNDIDEYFRRAAARCGVVNKLIDHLELPNFYHNEINIYPILAMVVLQCVQSFCLLRSHHHTHFVNEKFLTSIINCLSPKSPESTRIPKCCFFQFSKHFTETLVEFFPSEREIFTSETKIFSKWDKYFNDLDDFTFYEFNQSKVSDVLIKAKSVLYVDMKCSGGNGKSISEQLIQAGVVWKECPDFEEGDKALHVTKDCNSISSSEKELDIGSKKKDKKWRQCHVKNILNGNFIWCLIGTKAIKTFSMLSESLKKSASVLRKTIPQVDDVVVADMSDGVEISSNNLFRCRVVNLEGEDATVFAIDIGVIKKVSIHSLFNLPKDLDIEEIPSTASLVRLKGIIPPPMKEEAVEMTLTSLFAVCKPSLRVCDMVLKTNLFEHLPHLVISPNPALASRSLRLAAGLVHGQPRKSCNKWLRLIYACLLTLHNCFEMEQKYFFEIKLNGEGTQDFNIQDNHELISSCVLFLANRLYMCRAAKTFFYKSQGLDVVMSILTLQKLDFKIKEIATIVLNNFVHVTKNTDAKKR